MTSAFSPLLRNKYIERDLHKACLAKLEATSLLKDDNITPDLMIDCMQRLLKTDMKLNNLNLHVTTYYSILSDGTGMNEMSQLLRR